LCWLKLEKPLELKFDDRGFYVLEGHVNLSRCMILGCAFLFLSCSQLFPTDIKRILDDPREYDGKTVTISGVVTENVNIFLLKCYVVQDKTGEIVVVTKRAVPKKETKVKVSGVVKQAFAIGDKSMVVIVEED